MIKRNFIITIIFILSYEVVLGQVAEIQLDRNDYGRIRLSTHLCLDNIPENYYENNDTLFFILQLKGEENFSRGLIRDLNELKIEQFSQTTKIGSILTFENNSGRIDKLLLAYAKKEIDIYKPFEFIFQLNRSNPIQIPEEFWPKYTAYKNLYNSGKELYEKQKYLAAFQELKNLLPGGSENHMYYIRFSTYNQIYEQLIPDIINKIRDKYEGILDKHKTDYGLLEDINDNQLEIVKTIRDSITYLRNTIDIYYKITEPINITLKEKHDDLLVKSKAFYNDRYVVWGKTKLTVFEAGNYGRRNKFSVYTGILSRLLCYSNRLEYLSKLDSINTKFLNDDISFMRSYIDDLDFMEWDEEFNIILKIINEEIKNNKRLFSQSYFFNFQANMEHENQPNYYILYAFNELAKDNIETFKNNIQLAIMKCTDKELIYFLEMWMFSYQLNKQGINQKVIDNINLGLDLEANFLPNEAIKQYERARILDAKFSLPPFLIGRIKLLNENNTFAAERYFNEAINLNSSFVLARIYRLEIYIKKGQYKDVLSEITSAINNPNLRTWYIFYLKAKVHYLQNNYPAAMDVIQKYCLPLNKNNFEQFLLMGDISLKMNNCINAREKYQQAGNIDPDSPDYNQRMENLFNVCNQ
ncbi:MAG: hypothetical protein K8R37_14610 [Bacteroidales bacterium]|nr:hypothetical protein [Bacteroidales bacterium]